MAYSRSDCGLVNVCILEYKICMERILVSRLLMLEKLITP